MKQEERQGWPSYEQWNAVYEKHRSVGFWIQSYPEWLWLHARRVEEENNVVARI